MLNIIIVDDEQSVGNVFLKFLTRSGHQCELITNPLKATETINPLNYQLLLADYKMPGMNGVQLGLTFLGKNPEIKVIICSGDSDGFGPTEAKEKGFHGYLTKPITPLNKLLQTINDLKIQ